MRRLNAQTFVLTGATLFVFYFAGVLLVMPGYTAGWICINIIALQELSTSILLYPYTSTAFSIMHLTYGRTVNRPMSVLWEY